MRASNHRDPALWLAALIAASIGGCRGSDSNELVQAGGSSAHTDPVCAPACDGTTCGDDGCGGTCACDASTVCNASHQCVDPAACTDTCAVSGWECGDLCGASCGTCAAGDSCIWNGCYADANDTGLSCDLCSLQLTLLGKTVDGGTGQVTAVQLAIDYAPDAAEPRPRLADLRVHASMPVTLTAVSAGTALTDTGKQLYNDPITGNPWKVRTDGSHQLLVLSFSNTNRLAAGRIGTLDFSIDEPALTVEAGKHLAFRIVARDQTFAPPDADAAIAGTPLDRAVVVVP